MPGQNAHTDLTDDALLQQYKATGDNRWLGHLLQRYTALLLGVGLKYLRNRTLAEDAVQQVFVKAITHLPTEPIVNFKGWLYILMRNHCLQALRDKTAITDDHALNHLPAGEDDTGETDWQEQSLQQMDDAIAQLGEEQRQAIVLFYLEKLSYEQIIARTGYTFMQVKSYIQNGKRNLKTILMKKTGMRP